MKKKVLMWRQKGNEDWAEYDESNVSELEDYEVGVIYIYEYKVIEKEIK
jgi:hypothetical protein